MWGLRLLCSGQLVQLHRTFAIPDSGPSAGVGCPYGLLCAGRPGGRGRTSSRLPMPHGCPSCPQCLSGCGSQRQCSLWRERVTARVVPGKPRCSDAHGGPGAGLGKVQAETGILPTGQSQIGSQATGITQKQHGEP